MKRILVIILFTATSLWAQDRIYLKACSNEYSAEALAQFARSLASPIDQIDLDAGQSCIDIFTASAKQDLFTRGLKLKFGNIQIDAVSGSPNIVSGEHQCHLQFISESQQNKNERQGQIVLSNKKLYGGVYHQKSLGNQTQTTSLLASHIRASITVDWHIFSATCKKSNNGASVEIEISGPTLNLRNTIYLTTNSRQYLGEVTRSTLGSGQQVETIGIGVNHDAGNETKKIYVQLR